MITKKEADFLDIIVLPFEDYYKKETAINTKNKMQPILPSNLAVSKLLIEQSEKSGIDATVLSWFPQHGIKNLGVDRHTEAGGDTFENAEGHVEMGGDLFSNQDGLSPEQQQQLIDTAAQGTALLMQKLSEKKKSAYAQALKDSCGKKPLIGRKKRHRYFECQAKFNKEFANKEKISGVKDVPPTPPAPPSKAPKWVMPVAIIGSIGVLGTIGFFAFKKFKTKTA